VQIYTLSKGYHRHLTLTGLPQGKWQALAVDMTAARRPDGSGGPLSEDERIDDIQFYTDPDAELLIDDIVLYEAAPAGEKRPFPARLHFTGWFDTGKQGKEWPGDFEIVAKPKPHTWKAAKAVPNKQTGGSRVRVHLRRDREIGPTTQLRFRYYLKGTATILVLVAGPRGGRGQGSAGLVQGKWAETTITIGAGTAPGTRVNTITFSVPPGAELLVDDLLLYEPGEPKKAEKAP
jgi:hypothetical protein